MKANAALVRPDCIVVLDSIASIRTKISVIVFPIYSKNNNLIRLCKPFEYFMLFINRVFLDKWNGINSNLIDRPKNSDSPGLRRANPFIKLFKRCFIDISMK